jgi:protein-L-isoaspartate(D-aspartate) O-methyltransferase
LLALMLAVSCTDTAPSPGTPVTSEDTQQSEDEFFEARQAMVEFGIMAYGIDDRRVIEVMRQVPRHEFVPEAYLSQAYENHPLPIGHGQTISQPFIVALMTQELALDPSDKVLEIGTGSGYQAAILAELGVEVYSIEIIEALATEAQVRLERLGYSAIQVRHADGYFGWPEKAPFDAIIVTAAPDHIPQPLLDQLAEGGIMVIPVGPVGGFQELWRITRDDTGEVRSTSLGGVRFVPLTGTAERGGIP